MGAETTEPLSDGGLLARSVMRIKGIHSNHRRIAKGALYTGVLVLLAKVCVAAREIVIAWRYGISAEVDAYQLALTVITWLPMALSGVVTVVLVPRLVALRNSREKEAFIEELNGTLLLAGLLLTLALAFLGPHLVRLVGAGLSSRTRELAQIASWQLAPTAVAIVLGGYFGARLQAREHYAFSITEAGPAVFVLLFVLFLPKPSLMPLLWGTLAGYLTYVVWLVRMTKAADAPLGSLIFKHRSAQWGGIYGPLSTMVLAQFLMTVTLPLDQAFAASLGDGAIATLGYVNRIITLVTGLGSVVLARALLPVLSETASQDQHKLGQGQALKWACLMFAMGALIAVVGWALAPTGVRILFQRGAFHADDTLIVSQVLCYGLLQLPVFLAGMVLVQSYAAAARFSAILKINFTALIVKVVLNALLIRWLGLLGIMLATAAMYLVTTLLMGWRLRRGNNLS